MQVAVRVIEVLIPGVVLLVPSVQDGGVGPATSDSSQSAISWSWSGVYWLTALLMPRFFDAPV